MENRIKIIRIAKPQDYPTAAEQMEHYAEYVVKNEAPEAIWLLEHPHVYTLGRTAKPHDVLDGHKAPIIETTRGGQVTYHGPGQRIVWVVVDIRQHAPNIRSFVRLLQNWVIASLKRLEINSYPGEEHIGVWTKTEDGTHLKVAAFGLRVRQGVSRFGFSVNVDPDLTYYHGIIPCGIRKERYGVTSIRDILHNRLITTTHLHAKLDEALMACYSQFFKKPYQWQEQQTL